MGFYLAIMLRFAAALCALVALAGFGWLFESRDVYWSVPGVLGSVLAFGLWRAAHMILRRDAADVPF